MKIITLTLSPAFDMHCNAAVFKAGHENFATVTSRDAGGKGINISKALSKNGVENLAFVVLGKENSAEFRALLKADGVLPHEIEVEGRIRENITVHSDGSPETRISFPGFCTDDSLLTRVEAALEGRLDSDTLITLTGRIPDGISMACVQSFLRRLLKSGVRIVIDSKSFTFQDLIECKPYFIKPNEEEIAEYLGKSIKTLAEAAKAAEKMRLAGIENVMITLGERGAVLACKEGVYFAEAPKIKVASTIGAGDSAIAGFLAARLQNFCTSDSLRLSVAYGSAACLTEGTEAPCPSDIARLYDVCFAKRL